MNAKGFAWCCPLLLAGLSPAQTPAPGAAPPAIKLEDALTRARQYAGQIQSANLAVLQAHEDTAQARAARLPSLSALNQFLYTEGNGTPSGVYVANDGVHVYNEQAVLHQELLAVARNGEVRRASAAEALARAKVEVAARGLNATVVQDYYAIVSAAAPSRQRATQRARSRAVPRHHPGPGKRRRRRPCRRHQGADRSGNSGGAICSEAEAAIEKAKIALGVLIFPDFSAELRGRRRSQSGGRCCRNWPKRTLQAAATSPDLKSRRSQPARSPATTSSVARYGYLPSLASTSFTASTPTSSPRAPDIRRPVHRAQHAARITEVSTGAEPGLVGAGHAEYSAVELGRDAQQGQAGRR